MGNSCPCSSSSHLKLTALCTSQLFCYFLMGKYNIVLTSSGINSVRKETNGPGIGSGATGQL